MQPNRTRAGLAPLGAVVTSLILTLSLTAGPPPHASDLMAWTVPEAAKRLGIKRSAAYAYVRAGILPSFKLGGRLLVPRAAVLALVDKAMSEWGGPDAG